MIKVGRARLFVPKCTWLDIVYSLIMMGVRSDINTCVYIYVHVYSGVTEVVHS